MEFTRAASTSRYEVRTSLRGVDLYREPLLNKGSAFTLEERRRLGLEGLLPPQVSTMAQQVGRIRGLLGRLTDPFEIYQELVQLQDRNEHLFYRLLRDHLAELMPYVYTPTVAHAVRRYSQAFRRARGVWITPDHRGRIAEVLSRLAAGRQVRLIVLTDNESILGIGDQGAGGIALVNGKVALYCACAGIHPSEAMAISFDVGTESRELLEDEAYLGFRARRLRGADYDSLLDELVTAIRHAMPDAIVQWEDFRKDNAVRVLERYRKTLPSFNDDIQGTGAVAAAAVQVASRVTRTDLADQRCVIHGAGAAGYGIALQLHASLRAAGLDAQQARDAVAVTDSRGLVQSDGLPSSDYKSRIGWSAARIAAVGLRAGAPLADVVRVYKPTVLVGTSGQTGAFTREVIETMAAAVERPLVLPLSNPTDICEARPEDVLRWTRGRALVATGSPFDPVRLDDGRELTVGQGNNAFVYPAIGLAALVARPRTIDDDWLAIAARTLAETVTDTEIAHGMLYPAVERMPEVIRTIAIALVASTLGSAAAAATVPQAIWEPVYPQFK